MANYKFHYYFTSFCFIIENYIYFSYVFRNGLISFLSELCLALWVFAVILELCVSDKNENTNNNRKARPNRKRA